MRFRKRAGGAPGTRNHVSAGKDASAEDAPVPRRRPALTPVRALVVAGLLALTGWAVVGLSRSEPRRSGTNLTKDVGYVIPLGSRQELCEPGELLPGDTGALRLRASSSAPGGPRLSVSISDSAGRISSGALAQGWRSGTVSIPVSRIAQTLPAATVCIANLGDRQVSFGGSAPDASFYVAIAGKPLSGRLRIEYMRPGSESWFSLLPTLAHRFSLAKGGLVRHWAIFGTIVLMLLALALSVWIVLKEEDSGWEKTG